MRSDYDDQFTRVHIGRQRVHGGMAAVGMGLLATALALDLVYLIAGGYMFYSAAFWLMAAGGIALIGAVAPGLMAWMRERQDTQLYMSREDDGQLVVVTAALMTTIVGLTARMSDGAVVAPELGIAVALSVLTIALLGFAGTIGDWLADRFPSQRTNMRVTMSPEARTRETIER